MSSVLLITDDLSPMGGTGQKLKLLAEHTRCRLIFFLYNPEPHAAEFRDIVRRLRPDILVIECRDKFRAQVRAAEDVTRRQKCDTVIGSFFRGEALTASLRLPPDVSRGVWFHGCLRATDPIRALLPHLLYRRLHFGIYNSEFTRATLSRRYPVLSKIPGKVVYNGVSPRVRDAGFPVQNIQVGVIGGFIPARNHVTVLRAVARLYEEVRKDGVVVRLHLVGDGGSEKVVVRRTVAELNLSDVVMFHGYQKDPFEVLKGCTAFVNLATAEGFGAATVEAMLAGIPVVAANAGALPELISHGTTGLLVDAFDAAGLARAIRLIWSEPAKARRLATNARREAGRRFDPKVFASGFDDLVGSQRRSEEG